MSQGARRARGTTRAEAAALASKVSTAERLSLRLRGSSSKGVAASLAPAGRDVSGTVVSPRSTGFDPAARPRPSVVAVRQPAVAPSPAAPVDPGTARRAFYASHQTHFDLTVPAGISARESMRTRQKREKAAMYKPDIPSADSIGRNSRTSHIVIGGDSLGAERMPQKPTVKAVV